VPGAVPTFPAAPHGGPVRAVAKPLPTTRPIDTIVLVIKENRTYDALFGTFPGGNGEDTGDKICLDKYEDEIPHSRAIALRDRKTHVRCRVNPDNVPEYHALAKAFSLCDAFYSEVRGPSFPNHQVLVSGDFTALDDPGQPEKWHCPEHCYDLPTFPEALDGVGRTWKAYSSGFIPAFKMFRRLAERPEVVTWDRLAEDARRGTLPNMSWVYCERQDSEHPPNSLCRGEAWTVAQLNALMSSPQWPRMAVFVTWDDWGGIWDHVEPPIIEREADGKPIRFGHRVPCLAISPYARQGFISHETKSFLSIMRFALETLGVPLPEGRIRAASNMDDCFDWAQSPAPVLELKPRPCPESA
jgi:phospholipase C